MSVLFFFKAIISVRYRLVRQYRALRRLLVQRILYSVLIILPLMIYFRLFTNCSPFNFVVVLLILTLSELIMLLRTCFYLSKKSTIESIEELQTTGESINLQGFKQKPLTMWHFNKRLRAYVMQVHTQSVAAHIVGHLGIPFQPTWHHKLTKHYSYLKPVNNEQIKQFNRDRIEFRDDRQKKMMQNSG